MGKYSVYVGMDVHARSITAQALNVDTGEMSKKRFGSGYGAAEVASWVSTLGGKPYLAYESGCTGIWLARDLRALGIACDVIAVSTLARSDKDRQGKCDTLDARAILREIANPMSTYSCIYIPTAKEEGTRDLARLYVQAKDDAKRTKQELSSFLLRHGHTWCEKTARGNLKKPSGRAYEAWLDGLPFPDESSELAFSILRRRSDDAAKQLREMKRMMEKLSQQEESAPYVDALSALKGIDRLTAMVIKAEFCCFSRFKSGRKVSSWLGTVPKNASSGEKEAHGSITKAGNKRLRRALIEGISGISTWKGGAKRAPERLPAALAHTARTANERLYERWRHLRVDEGKNANKAKVAIANELVRWCWVIGCSVEQTIP